MAVLFGLNSTVRADNLQMTLRDCSCGEKLSWIFCLWENHMEWRSVRSVNNGGVEKQNVDEVCSISGRQVHLQSSECSSVLLWSQKSAKNSLSIVMLGVNGPVEFKPFYLTISWGNCTFSDKVAETPTHLSLAAPTTRTTRVWQWPLTINTNGTSVIERHGVLCTTDHLTATFSREYKM